MTDLTRRDLLKSAAAATIVLAAAGCAGDDEQAESTPEAPELLRKEQDLIRENNGDEESLVAYAGSFTKTLPHDENGLVDVAAYESLLAALQVGRIKDFEQVTVGARKLANPDAAFGVTELGPAAGETTMKVVHSLASEEQAAEAAEVYWMAAVRDTPFSEFSSSQDVADAITELNNFDALLAPRTNGDIDTGNVFRGLTEGDLAGDYISQFLIQDVPMGSTTLDQSTAMPIVEDFMGDWDECLSIQNGDMPTREISLEEGRRHILTPRDLAHYVHYDFSYQAYLNSALMTMSWGTERKGSPYSSSSSVSPFINLGGADILDVVSTAARCGLVAAWFYKWRVHRKLRPEEFGLRLDSELNNVLDLGLDSSIVDSEVTQRMLSTNGNALLPQAYPEGSPTHPSYPAGHAVVAGACSTVLKAFFDESSLVPNPQRVERSGTSEVDLELTVGGELNKLASNIALGRNFAGVHWRADGDEGLDLGEQVATFVLQSRLRESRVDAHTFEFTGFDGSARQVSSELIA